MLASMKPSRELLRELRGVQQLDEQGFRKVLQLKDLLDKVLVLDPAKRLSLNDALRHTFITDK